MNRIFNKMFSVKPDVVLEIVKEDIDLRKRKENMMPLKRDISNTPLGYNSGAKAFR